LRNLLACCFAKGSGCCFDDHGFLFFRLFDVSNVHRFVHLSKRLCKKVLFLTFGATKKRHRLHSTAFPMKNKNPKPIPE